MPDLRVEVRCGHVGPLGDYRDNLHFVCCLPLHRGPHQGELSICTENMLCRWASDGTPLQWARGYDLDNLEYDWTSIPSVDQAPTRANKLAHYLGPWSRRVSVLGRLAR